MTIVLTGAGSGGHITPVLAVAHELRRLNPTTQIVYVGQRGDSLSDVIGNAPDIEAVYAVSAGKFRRYHNEGIKQLFDIPTLAKNARDLVRVILGFFQSRRLLKKLKADAIFVKGGIVGVPLGLAAASLHLPYVTHDSDALPGLGHRIIARWAKVHAVALPKEAYTKYYPMSKTVTVGVPVAAHYKLVNAKLQVTYKKQLQLQKEDKLLLITGGGNGAKRLNNHIAEAVPELFTQYPELHVVHIAGRSHEQQLGELYDALLSDSAQRKRVVVKGFVEDFYRYSGAADLIIARAGATNIAEFAIQAKACIIVPNPNLTGGHQLKNAEQLARSGAVEILSEEDLMHNTAKIVQATGQLLSSPKTRQALGSQLNRLANPHAARQLAEILLKHGKLGI